MEEFNHLVQVETAERANHTRQTIDTGSMFSKNKYKSVVKTKDIDVPWLTVRSFNLSSRISRASMAGNFTWDDDRRGSKDWGSLGARAAASASS
jgi:hypothetical protein